MSIFTKHSTRRKHSGQVMRERQCIIISVHHREHINHFVLQVINVNNLQKKRKKEYGVLSAISHLLTFIHPQFLGFFFLSSLQILWICVILTCSFTSHYTADSYMFATIHLNICKFKPSVSSSYHLHLGTIRVCGGRMCLRSHTMHTSFSTLPSTPHWLPHHH